MPESYFTEKFLEKDLKRVSHVEFDNPFWTGDGALYFTSGAKILRYNIHEKTWDVVIKLNGRINAVWLSPEGTLHAVAGTTLFRYRSGKWSKLKVRAPGAMDVLTAVFGFNDQQVYCADYSGNVHIINGHSVASTKLPSCDMLLSIHGNSPENVWFGGRGVFRYDGKEFHKELDERVSHIFCPSAELVYAAGYEKGAVATEPPCLYRRSKQGVWEELSTSLFKGNDLQGIALYQGHMYVSNYSGGIFEFDGKEFVQKGDNILSIDLKETGPYLAAAAMD